ncbi:MAG: 3-hydroxyacyl-ACP dehydratase FabZ [Gammaproteobacteria bacterium]|nr:3-hydroxyacyl-ACP dehydratase FabZ [Gammaproteobacteria bacterium]
MEEASDIREIIKYLPHRYPFLLVDRIESYEQEKELTALKNVTANEPIFTGHFPQAPIFPGVLILEAMAQASALLAFKSLGGYPSAETLYLLVGIDKARFKNQVVPGDQMRIQVLVDKVKRGIWVFQATARVEDKLAASAEVIIAKNEIEL